MLSIRYSRRALILAISSLMLVAMSLAVPASNAHAQSLSDAKAQGLVGEQANGYLGVPPGVSNPAAAALVQRINAQRRAAYGDIAKKNATNLQSVEALAGRKLIGRLGAGQWFKDAQGNWRRK